MSASALRDLVGIAGFGLVTYGVYLVSLPAACVVAGGMMLSLSLVGWIRNDRRTTRGK